MAKLIITVETDLDPTLEDPEQVAEDILGIYEDHRRVNQRDPEVTLVQASWET